MERSFTLIEILLVLGILAILVFLTLPLSMSLYGSQQLDSHTQDLIQVLRRAQLKAMTAEADSSFGIHFDENQRKYILFKGDFFDPESPENEEFNLPQVITINTPFSEVIFSKLNGEPNVFGNIILDSNGESRIININKLGRVSLIPAAQPYLAQLHYRWRNDDGVE
jgi:Tfp pilus assembly protein FimT